MRGNTRATGAILGAGALLLSGAAWSQTQIYCTVTSVKSEALSNATRTTISADGILDFDTQWTNLYQKQGVDWTPQRTRSIAFSLPTARTSLGSFVDVGLYPVSHVQFAIPRDSREGVGLEVTVWLYRAAVFTHVETRGWHTGSRRSSPPLPSYEIDQSQDGRSIIIIVRSDRYREPEVAHEEAAPARPSLSVTGTGEGLVSVRALNVRLGEVLRAVAETVGLRIVVRGGADYRASMVLERAPPATLMRVLARAYGLSVRLADGVYYVTEGLPTEVDSYWASPTVTLPVRNVTADVALDLLPDFLLRYVHVNAEQNALVAAGPPQLLDKLEADLRVIDQPQRQVELSALLVESRTTGGLDLASDLVFSLGVYAFAGTARTGQLSYHVVNDPLHDLQVKLQALERRGVIRTRVCPSITVGGGDRAELFLGRRQYFTFLTTVSGGAQEVTLTSRDVGSRITAQPWTGDGHTITIPLGVQANTVTSVDEQGLPLVATRQVGGTLRVQSGDTIVFTGLSLDLDDRTRGRVAPTTAPLVGQLVRSHRRASEATEVLVLLSARSYVDTGEAHRPPEHS